MTVIQFAARPEKPTKCRIRIAVAVDDEGNWAACGASRYDENYSIDDLLDEELPYLDGDAKQQYWLVVDIPIPPTTVHADPSEADD